MFTITKTELPKDIKQLSEYKSIESIIKMEYEYDSNWHKNYIKENHISINVNESEYIAEVLMHGKIDLKNLCRYLNCNWIQLNFINKLIE